MNMTWFGRQMLSAAGLVCLLSACGVEPNAEDVAITGTRDAVVDVAQTSVERQSIGNCWIYAHASWIESMHLTETGEQVDLSQSYWTYWHWFDQITGYLSYDAEEVEISTGGNWSTANGIVRRYGLLPAASFVADDTLGEMSFRQATALSRINESLEFGALSTVEARMNRALVRSELDAAWELSDGVKSTLDTVFGAAVERTLNGSGTRRAVVGESGILDPSVFGVAYVKRAVSRRGVETLSDVHTNVTTAMSQWRAAYYARSSRDVIVRTQRALHARQPVIMTWNVDFNAMETGTSELRGSFNLGTLQRVGAPGSQGGHMVVIEDYEADTTEFGRLAAGVTLDPSLPEDAQKLAAALRADTAIRFIRVKNSWGTARPDRGSAPGFPGYHDLYLDYLNGPIAWCPNRTAGGACTGTTTPLQSLLLPPGF